LKFENLWDVSDKDVDKLSIECMSLTFKCNSSSEGDDGDAVSIAEGLARARKVCKLKNIVGCSPVMYGLPSHFK